MDPGDLHDAYTVRSLDDLAKIYATPLPTIATKETDHITEVGRALISYCYTTLGRASLLHESSNNLNNINDLRFYH